MDKYTDPSATPSGEFTDGDPQLDIPRSLMTAQWPNMIQRELISLVQGAGLPLDAQDFSQVLQAVISLAGSNGFVTGDIKYSYRPTAPAGWLWLDGRTIGAAGSSASALADSKAEALFKFLWDTFPDTVVAVSGGRGVSAQDDWTDLKVIRLFDDRGEFHRVHDNLRGVDDLRPLGSPQLDQMQRITGSVDQIKSGPVSTQQPGQSEGALTQTKGANAQGDGGNRNGVVVAFDSALSPGARTGQETRPRNRAVSAFIKL